MQTHTQTHKYTFYFDICFTDSEDINPSLMEKRNNFGRTFNIVVTSCNQENWQLKGYLEVAEKEIESMREIQIASW